MPPTPDWVYEARQAHVKDMAVLPRPDLAQVRDLVIAGLPVRLYVPDTTAHLPVLVYFHGGGWILGDVESYDPAARTLALACGAAVISVDYRRPPEHPFPAAVDDAETVVRWVATEAGTLGLDASRLGVAGDSAGGQIAAATALRLTASGDAPRLAVQLLIYPALDLTAAPSTPEGNPSANDPTRRLLEQMFTLYLGDTDRTRPEASPLLASDLEGLPTTVVVTAEQDLLRGQGEQFARRTRAVGVPTTLITGHGLPHGFLGREPSIHPETSATGRFGQRTRTAFEALQSR
ncbi:alpha/beta hydrolase [Nocardiopsis synnemataformans]|uniref:alpha/beta hydrolase n=1 Tax=Nocardiopsis synnemataformans TaxID=61305 RepID=UPI003EBCE510